MTDPAVEPGKAQKNQTLKVLLPVLIIGFLALASFWLLSSRDDDSHPHSLDEVSVVETGSFAPDLVLHRLQGESQKLSSLKAELIVLNFWASWCVPCLVEMPSLLELQKQYQDQGLRVVLVNVDEEPHSKIPSIQSKLNAEFVPYIDSDQILSATFDVTGLPLTVILNKRGKVLSMTEGERDWASAKIQLLIQKYLKEEAAASGGLWD